MDQGTLVGEIAATDAGERPRSKRIVWIDVARGTAIVAMAIYHFAWDLQHFGYITAPTVDVGGWKMFARADASSFLFLVGVSVVLAHHPEIRWRPFWKRFAQIVAGAAAITLVTWFVTPRSFIFFGILHSIALGSLVGLLFLKVPPAVTLAAAIFAFFAPWFLRSTVFDFPPLWFAGLSKAIPHSNDYVPLFPWLAPLLCGIAVARAAKAAGFFEWLREHAPRPNPIISLLTFGGRHSLVVYLLHQPLLFGLVFLASQVAPAAAPDPTAAYLSSCQTNCATERDGAFCRRFCSCTLNGLLDEKLFNGLNDGSIDITKDPRIGRLAEQCTRTSEMQEPK